MVETRTSGETWSCGRDKDQWGRYGTVAETRTSGESRLCFGDKELLGGKQIL